MKKHSILYLSHGGGPLPLLGDSSHQELVDCLKNIRPQLIEPAAIVVFSAHWESESAAISGSAEPSLIYDYFGFPSEAYQINYPAKGNPILARRINSILQQVGIESSIDEQRGFDHGMFVPLSILFPEANIPCVQISLINSLDANAHIKLGKALASLKDENVLFIGSGFSFHNMNAFFTANQNARDDKNVAFEDWLIDTLGSNELTEQQRELRLVDWQSAPYARYCHPREEHLLPLHVCYGIAGSASLQHYRLTILNKIASMYLW